MAKSHKSVDVDYFRIKLQMVIRDLYLYTGNELALELQRLANTASDTVSVQRQDPQHNNPDGF